MLIQVILERFSGTLFGRNWIGATRRLLYAKKGMRWIGFSKTMGLESFCTSLSATSQATPELPTHDRSPKESPIGRVIRVYSKKK